MHSMNAEITLTIPLSATVPNMPVIININSNHPGNFNKTFQTSELELQSRAETKTIPHWRNFEVATSYGQYWISKLYIFVLFNLWLPGHTVFVHFTVQALCYISMFSDNRDYKFWIVRIREVVQTFELTKSHLQNKIISRE